MVRDDIARDIAEWANEHKRGRTINRDLMVAVNSFAILMIAILTDEAIHDS